MKNKPSIGELLEALEIEIGLMKEGNNGNENIGKIKALSLMLEERVDALYRQLKWKRKPQEKSEILESGNETCVCGLVMDLRGSRPVRNNRLVQG